MGGIIAADKHAGQLAERERHSARPNLGATHGCADHRAANLDSQRQSIATNTMSFVLPQDWGVYKTDNCSSDVHDANKYIEFYVAACTVSQPVTTDSLQQSLESNIRKTSPDVAVCGNPITSSLGTPPISGVDETYCYTFTNTAGKSWPAYLENWVGVSSSGKAFFRYVAFGTKSAYSSDRTKLNPILASIQWKLSPTL